MTLKKVLYRTRVHITGSWKKAWMMHPLLRVVFISLLAAQATPNTVWAQMKAVPPLSGVIGKVQSVTDGFIDVQTGSGVVHVDIARPLTTYKQVPSDLSHVTSTSYVGVASTEQAESQTTRDYYGRPISAQIYARSASKSVSRACRLFSACLL